MNIFYLDNNQEKCAEYHTNKHTVKMILEYGQMLSTAHRILSNNMNDNCWLPKAAFINHPCSIWVRKSNSNYLWLFKLFNCLLKEYTYRYGKIHKYNRYLGYLSLLPLNIPSNDFTEPPQCMPDTYKVKNNCILAYHNYYNGEKRSQFKWKNREIPYFIKEGN